MVTVWLLTCDASANHVQIKKEIEKNNYKHQNIMLLTCKIPFPQTTLIKHVLTFHTNTNTVAWGSLFLIISVNNIGDLSKCFPQRIHKHRDVHKQVLNYTAQAKWLLTFPMTNSLLSPQVAFRHPVKKMLGASIYLSIYCSFGVSGFSSVLQIKYMGNHDV